MSPPPHPSNSSRQGSFAPYTFSTIVHIANKTLLVLVYLPSPGDPSKSIGERHKLLLLESNRRTRVQLFDSLVCTNKKTIQFLDKSLLNLGDQYIRKGRVIPSDKADWYMFHASLVVSIGKGTRHLFGAEARSMAGLQGTSPPAYTRR